MNLQRKWTENGITKDVDYLTVANDKSLILNDKGDEFSKDERR